MAKPEYLHMFVDPARCIGCQACFHACTECDTHKGDSMIHLEYISRADSVQTVPVVCMHCEQPTCAEPLRQQGLDAQALVVAHPAYGLIAQLAIGGATPERRQDIENWCAQAFGGFQLKHEILWLECK